MIRHGISFKALNINIKESKQFCFKFLFLRCKKYFWVWTLAVVRCRLGRGAKLRGEAVGHSLLIVVSFCLWSELGTTGS